MSDFLYKQVKFANFREAYFNHPIIYAHMKQYRRSGNTDYVTALEDLVVALANQNIELSHQLAVELAGGPSEFIQRMMKGR